ncbi:MAG TPA: hypothetical protein VF870_01685 [Ignavibacteriaceae bacterium]
MITAFIFFVHLIFGLVIFTKKWQDENLTAGFLNITLILILFAVGWAITGIVAKLVMEPKGFGMQFDRDTFSLTLLTIIEFFFYKFYYQEDPIAADKEKQ